MRLPFAEGLRSRHIAPFDPDAVTSREGGQPEADPLSVGLLADDVEAIWAAVVALYRTGLQPAIALCLRRGGQVMLDRAIGHASGNSPADGPDVPKVQATPATLFNLFSASKALIATLIHMLDDRGLVRVDDPVAAYVPEFAQRGKEWVTLRHVLTHRAGIPRLPAEKLNLDILADWDAIIALICGSEPSHLPGRSLAYHALTGGWVLAEVLQRVTGQTVRQFMRQELLDPLGVEHLDFGTSPQLAPTVALSALTGPPVLFPFSAMIERVLGVPFADAVAFSNDHRYLTGVIPAGNAVGTANETCLFYEMLLRGGALGGHRFLSETAVRRATTEQTWREVDVNFGLPMRYSMGFFLGDEWISIYGPNTAGVFGHLGLTTITAFADPTRDISVCLMTTGKHLLSPHLWHHLGVLRAITSRCPRL